MPKPRILLYSHDTYGLGHLRRSLAIAQSISQHIPHSRQLLITGSMVAGAFSSPARLDMIKLPALSKRSSGEYMPRTLPLSLEQTIHWRSEMIYQAAQHFQPDLILVDKSAAGVRGELLRTLEHVRQRMPQTHIVLGMRDIEDEPGATRAEWAGNGTFAAIERYYDAILLYGERRVFDPIDAYGLSPEIAARVIECGYIAREFTPRAPRLVRRELGLADKPFVLVTAGGGGDGYALIRTAVEMFELNRPDNFLPLLVTGPLMPHQQRKELAARAEKAGIPLVEFTPDLNQYMQAADLIVGMAGYNTVCEIMALQKRAVLVPRDQVRQEQKIRAERLEAMGLVRMISNETLSPQVLLEAISTGLSKSRPSASLNMDGLATATRVLASILNIPDTVPYRIPAELFSRNDTRRTAACSA